MKKRSDLIISGATILSMDADLNIYREHDLIVTDGKISAIAAQGKHDWQALQSVDAHDCIVMPGMINTHSHLPMSWFRGLADDLPLDIWLNHYIWPLEARLLSKSFIYDATLFGAGEMLKSGITMTNDMYFEMSAIAEACSKAGLRALISEAVIEAKMGADYRPSLLVLKYKEQFRDQPLVDFSLAPHSIYTCSSEMLKRCADAALEHGLLIHIHLSETAAEVENCLSEHGKRPVHYLNDLGLFEAKCLLAHGVHVDSSEMEVLQQKPVSIGICTDSNLKLASGLAPIKSYLEHGINLSLGTDSVASNNDLDLLGELSNTAKLHKALNHDPAFLPAIEALKLVTINAAKALGVEERRGSLEVGKDADFLIIDTQSLNSQPLYEPASQLVYATNSRQIRDVFVAGRQGVKEQRLVNLDEAELLQTAGRYAQLIREELGL